MALRDLSAQRAQVTERPVSLIGVVDVSEIHRPVLLREVIELLAPSRGGVFLDLTVGGGGHAEAILEAMGESGRLVGCDRDPAILSHAAETLERFGSRASLHEGIFTDFPKLLERLGIGQVDGILMDLGVSSLQLDDPERGFSLRKTGRLDMRMTPSRGRSASKLLTESSAEELEEIFRTLGEEPRARLFARRLVELCRRRPPRTTTELAAFIDSLTPRAPGRKPRIHPATRVFQALRMAVNEEASQLLDSLPLACEALASGGRLVVISFQSLDDRVVKNFFRDQEKAGVLRRMTRKAIRPSEDETRDNPRARSAQVRGGEKC